MDDFDDLSGLAAMVFTPIPQQRHPDQALLGVEANNDSLNDSELERCLDF